MEFKVEPEIFVQFPEVRMGVLWVLGMDNGKGWEEIARLLAIEQEKKKKELVAVDLKNHPKVAPWREIYQKFGSKPREFRSSIESLLRRIVNKDKLPNINPLVDLYNYISIKHLLPAGAEDLDKVKGDIILGLAKGTEKGKYIGSSELSACYAGEVVYKDELGFICRRWNWREGERTKITSQTRNAVVVIEANKNVSNKELELALKETSDLIQKYLGAKVAIKILDKLNLSSVIDFSSGSGLRETDLKAEVRKLPIQPKPKIKEVERPVPVDKKSFAYKLREAIFEAAIEIVGKKGARFENIVFDHPANPAFGDYSTNFAMKVKLPTIQPAVEGKDLSGFKKGPSLNCWDLANQIVNAWRSAGLPDYVAKIEVAKPGFINIWLKNDILINQIGEVLRGKDGFGKLTIYENKKILLEHTSPNPQTTIMLGHLRNNFLGMSVANILSFCGAKVKKDCIINDRGVHLCRAIWGYLVFGQKRGLLKKEELLNFREVKDDFILQAASQVNWQELLGVWAKKKSSWWQPKDLGLKSDHANLIWYVLGSRAYGLSEKAKAEVEEILLAWEKEDGLTWKVWRQILDWSESGYSQTYKRIGSVHDWVWHESEHYKLGKEIVKEGLKKRVFRKSEGAIVTLLEKFGLPDTVVVKTDGTALYITQDLALTRLKKRKFPSDLYIWVVGSEQSLYFKQLFSACEQLGINKREKLLHLAYALINFKGGGKMATRKGNVMIADEVLDDLEKRALAVVKSTNQELRGKLSKERLRLLAKKVSIGAIKYSLLKYGRDTTMYFDPVESLALEGNSAPYLQYTYARCQSVIKKGERKGIKLDRLLKKIPKRILDEEEAIIREIYKFPEVVLASASGFSPNLICNFLFDLSQKYNLFYNTLSVLQAETSEKRALRLALTAAVAQIIKNGLRLLGIEALERM